MQITETVIPLDFLSGLSPFNVRQLDPSDDVSSLKATVRAVGLINPLVVHRGADNRFVVLAGGRRWRALCEIEAETPGAFWNIPAKMVEGATDAELIALSTMENTQTLAMHPVRQFEAFAAIAHALPSPEQAVEVIAKEFGLTRQQVRQRLALGDLSPKIRKAWLDGEINAEAARAYAVSDDIAAQEAFFDDPANKPVRGSPWNIKKSLLGDWRNAWANAVRFVGEAAYRAAGGEVRESLFEEERFFQGALIDKLANAKLCDAGERLCKAEGWGFYTTPADDSDGYDQLGGFEPDYLPEEAARRDAIDELIRPASGRDLAADAPGHEVFDALFAEADAIEAKATMRALTAAQRASLGVDVDFDYHGRLVVVRAIQRSSMVAADEGDGDFDEDDASEPAPRASTPSVEKPTPLPPAEPIGKGLRTVLDETMNAALQDVTGRNVNLALIYAVATLGCQCGGSILDLRLHARRGWTPRHELLKALAQLRFEKALQLAAASSLNDLTTAFCELVGAAIDTARYDKIGAGLDLLNVAAPRAAIGDALVEHFDPALYFHAATRDAAIAAIRELEGEAKAAERGKLKKPDLIEHVTVIARHRNWLPPVLRLAPVATPDPLSAPGFLPEFVAPEILANLKQASAPDTRTTAEAMLDAIEATEGGSQEEIYAAIPDKDVEAGVASVYPDDANEPIARIANFLEWCCTRGPDAGRTKAQTLHNAFTQWDALRGHAAVSLALFGHTLENLGVRKHRISAGVHYLDIALNIAATEAAQ
jgi:ParB family chromosome partitioning protein